MKRRSSIWVLGVFLILSLVGCSGSNSSSKTSFEANDSKSISPASDTAKSMKESASGDTGDKNKKESDIPDPGNKRMIIYNAELTVTVKDFKKAQRNIQSFIDASKGYTVNSSVSKDEDGGVGATIVARIPEPQFNSFIDQISKSVEKVQDQTISGEDVTKQYVDLESRLRAKEEVEARLNTFLKQAKDTSDLLKISDELGQVQADIESIKGQMNYLKNHSDLSTVTIHLYEKTVKIKDKEDLNTWDKTKNAFISSINAIVTFFSGLFIFIAGYSPIIIPLIIIGLLVYFIIRRRKRKE